MDERRIRQIFDISVLLKGAHAVIECVGGVALALISTDTIAKLVHALTQSELTANPNDFVASHILHWSHGFSVSTQHFYAWYLLSHGLVKIVLVIGLLRSRLWAYPASLVVLSLFILYQLYRFSYTHSVGLILLTAFDIVVIGLICHEYRLVRQHLAPRSAVPAPEPDAPTPSAAP